METLGQSHLQTKLEVPRLTCLGRESNRGLQGGRRSLYEELFEQRIISYSEHLQMSPLQYNQFFVQKSNTRVFLVRS